MISWFTQSLSQFALLLLVCWALYMLPGLAVLRFVWPNTARPLSAAERFGLAIAISLALPPILIYCFRLAGLKWSATATWVYVAFAFIVCVVPTALFLTRQTLRSILSAIGDALPLIAITLLGLVIRLYAVRELHAGLFGDSMHHTMIVQLLLDNGGLFDSWEPYAPMASMTYHFGFHANVAFYAWLTGIPSTLSLLIIGQVLNAAAAPMAYLLVSRLLRTANDAGNTHNDFSRFPIAQVAGLIAAALTAFASLMPFYYSNWGRYTQLAGQLLLPAVVIVWGELIECASERRGQQQRSESLGTLVTLAAALTLALMLTHYIVTIWAALLVGSYLVVSLARRANLRDGVAMLIPSAMGAGLALIIALPWIRNTLTGRLASNAAAFGNGAVDAGRLASISSLQPITPFFLRGWMLILGGLALVFALAQRRWRVTMLALWAVLITLSTMPQIVGLPGIGTIDTFTGYIALYVVAVPLAGYAVAALVEWAVFRLRTLVPVRRWSSLGVILGTTLVALVIGAWSTTWLPSVIEPSRQMLTAGDERAMVWIRDNIPIDARFVVNTFPAYGGTLIAGTDGGWWIPLLTRRATTLPPMTYGSERFERDDFYARTNGLAQALRGRPLTDGTPVTVDLTTLPTIRRLYAEGVTHVYIGANPTPDTGLADHIDADALRHSNAYRLIYDQDGVYIFKLVQ